MSGSVIRSSRSGKVFGKLIVSELTSGSEGYPMLDPSSPEGGFELLLPIPLDKKRVREMTEALDLTTCERAYSSLVELVQSGSVSETSEGEVVAGLRVDALMDEHHSVGTVFKMILSRDVREPNVVINELGSALYVIRPDASMSYTNLRSPWGDLEDRLALERLNASHALQALRHDEAEVSPLS